MRCVKAATAPARPECSTSEDIVVRCGDTILVTDFGCSWVYIIDMLRRCQ